LKEDGVIGKAMLDELAAPSAKEFSNNRKHGTLPLGR
jgi:hypothetical protein